MLSLALQVTIGKYASNCPDWVISLLWLMPLIPLGYIAITHAKLAPYRQRYVQRWRSKRLATLAGTLFMVIVIVVSFAGAAITAWRALVRPVATPFSNLYEEHALKMGKPTKRAKPIRVFYQAVYQRATFVWMSNPLKFYVIENNGKWHEEKENTLPPAKYGSCPYYCDDVLRKMFPPPSANLGPPFGSAAYKWGKNPEHWEQMLGWREWHCNFLEDSVELQTFEHGRAIGPMRFRSSTDADVFARENGNVYVLLDDGTWQQDISREQPKTYPCDQPLTPLLKP